MQLHDPSTEGETDPRARIPFPRLERTKHREDALTVVFVEADAVVLHRQLELVSRERPGPHGDDEWDLGTSELQSIVEEVAEHVSEPGGIQVHDRERVQDHARARVFEA